MVATVKPDCVACGNPLPAGHDLCERCGMKAQIATLTEALEQERRAKENLFALILEAIQAGAITPQFVQIFQAASKGK